MGEVKKPNQMNDYINKIIQGHALEVLKSLPSESVDCVITSPPYFGLRSYGTEPQVWGGNKDCQHEWIKTRPRRNRKSTDVKNQESKESTNKGSSYNASFTDTCQKCQAWKGELGLEPNPELYVQHIVEIFREVKRVLKNTGVIFLNLGDSWAGGGGASGHTPETKNFGRKTESYGAVKTGGRTFLNIKPKDLIGIPWMVAFALRNDGWWLRQDIIWEKRNPMPEPVRDRCTKSHEYIFLLSKSQHYFFDNKAILEEASYDGRKDTIMKGSKKYDNSGLDSHSRKHERWPHVVDGKPMRNKRSVWSVNVKPFHGAHFATFNEELIAPCILAGCPKGGVVLDPFIGSGTTGIVALKNGRNFIGIELLPENVKMSMERIRPFLEQRKLSEVL